MPAAAVCGRCRGVPALPAAGAGRGARRGLHRAQRYGLCWDPRTRAAAAGPPRAPAVQMETWPGRGHAVRFEGRPGVAQGE